MSVHCKSKFTSYVKHYTWRQKQRWFLVLKDICVSIKSASCVLNTAGWSYSDQMAFCLRLEICQTQLFSRTASVSGSFGEMQDEPLVFYQSWRNPNFPVSWAVEQPRGHARSPEAPKWQESIPNQSCAAHPSTAEPASLVKFIYQREMTKEERPSCAN